jgi:transcriptional regulator with XRE-family HTH domain
MTTASNYVRESRHAETTPGEALKIVRTLQGLSQSELARRSRVKQSAISAIERGEMGLGIERAKALALALHVHPAVLAFPGWRDPADRLESRPGAARTRRKSRARESVSAQP